MSEENRNLDTDVIKAFLKLSRAMRRCPPQQGPFPFPPAVGRLLECAAANPGVSSRELCEALDLRPSSLSEILARAESKGLLSRTADENDRRVQRVSLTPVGSSCVSDMEAARNEDAKKKTACLTEEEKALFCSLCDRLSGHIEKLALDLPEGLMPDRPGPRPGPRRCPGGPWRPDEESPGFPRRPGEDVAPDYSRHPGEGMAPDRPRHPGEDVAPDRPRNPGEDVAPDRPRNPGEDRPDGPGRPPFPPGGRFRC